MFEIALPQTWFAQVKMVEIGNESLDALMIRAGSQQPPFDFSVGVPFVTLANLAAHEQQHLAREEPLIAEQRAQVGKSLPIIPGHPAQQRTFAMHDLVV